MRTKKTEVVRVYMTESELSAIDRAAERDGLSRSTWLRVTGAREASRVAREIDELTLPLFPGQGLTGQGV